MTPSTFVERARRALRHRFIAEVGEGLSEKQVGGNGGLLVRGRQRRRSTRDRWRVKRSFENLAQERFIGRHAVEQEALVALEFQRNVGAIQLLFP